jgi:cell division protein FtsW
MKLISRVRINQPDYVFITLALALVVVGLIILSSASSVISFQKFQDSYYYLKHQALFGLLPGLVLFLFFSKFDYQRLKPLALPALIVSFILLIAVFIPGVSFDHGGSRRWLAFGTFVFQPSELVKLALIIYLAAWLESRGSEGVRSWSHCFIPFVLVVGTILGLIILQPDLGTMSVLAFSAFVVYLVAGARLTQLFALAGVGLTALWFLVKFFPHSARRLTVFLNPALEPKGVGYHINQALLAIGSGGWLGLGLGYSRQKYQYLPEVTGDSIFAVMAEELGFIFTVFFLALVASFLFRGWQIVKRAPDTFGRYLGAGILAWLGWQTCLNIASMLRLVPLTGLPLPFVSYGGTALVAALAAVGILVNISRQSKKADV